MSLQKLSVVFIVEDNAADRAMMTDFISNYEGVIIKTFVTGDACIREIVNQTVPLPNLIMMDYFLDASFASKYDGLDTLTKVKEISPSTNIIMFTSVKNARIIELSKEKGALDYVVKGVEGFDRLDTIIRNNFKLN